MQRLQGKVAVVSGGARGQGRADAVALAKEGADIVTFDICAPIDGMMYPAPSPQDLAETKRLVESLGRRCLAAVLDARDLPGLIRLADKAMSEFGRVDALVVNHGIWLVERNTWELSETGWATSIDVNLNGAWKVSKAFIPKILQGERGGTVTFISSIAGTGAQPGSAGYSASKHGILGLMRTLAWELGARSVRVNAILPGPIDSPMATEGHQGELARGLYPGWFIDRKLLPLRAGDKKGDIEISSDHGMPPEVIAKAVVFLASEDAAFITGTSLPVDAGVLNF